MSEPVQEMVNYLVSEIIRDPHVKIDETTTLVSSGLVDSLALVDILLKLEELANVRIPAGKVQAKDMDTVQLMFATANRVGRRKG